MTMHLAQGLSTINTKKRKTKITKARMAQLQENWRVHNKTMKQKGMHDLRYEKFEDYLDYCFGRKKKPNPRDRSTFQSMVSDTSAYRETTHYPSLMEEQMKSGTFSSECMSKGTKQEPMKYTGDLIAGIATMHKSNAVPVMKGTDQAKDIARMRR